MQKTFSVSLFDNVFARRMYFVCTSKTVEQRDSRRSPPPLLTLLQFLVNKILLFSNKFLLTQLHGASTQIIIIRMFSEAEQKDLKVKMLEENEERLASEANMANGDHQGT